MQKLVMGMAVAILVVLVAGCASLQPKYPIQGAFIGASVADTITTQGNVSRGATETNLLLGSQPSAHDTLRLKIAGYMALAAIQVSWEHRLGRKLRWTERLLIWGVPTILAGLAAYSNARVASSFERVSR